MYFANKKKTQKLLSNCWYFKESKVAQFGDDLAVHTKELNRTKEEKKSISMDLEKATEVKDVYKKRYVEVNTERTELSTKIIQLTFFLKDQKKRILKKLSKN